MPKKGENIYKRKDGRWEGRYIKTRTTDGKAVYGSVYASTYREVKTKLMAAVAAISETIQAEVSNSIPKVDSDQFGSVAAEWLEDIRPQVKESTYNKYRNLLESYILPEFRDAILCSITQESIKSHCDGLLLQGGQRKTGLSAKTVSDVLSVIRSVLRFAAKMGKPVSFDVRSIRIKQSVTQMRVLSRSEQDRLYQHLSSDLNPANIGILVCLFTGIRIGEVCALQWDDISLSEQTIYVHQTMQRVQNKQETDVTAKTRVIVTTPKSACSIRTIPIPDVLTEYIIRHKTSAAGYFLTNSCLDYMEPRVLQMRFKQVLKKCSVEGANYHSLRHTFATRCIELGFDVKSLSEILCHASVNITMNRYVHPSMDLKRENMRRLSDLIAVK